MPQLFPMNWMILSIWMLTNMIIVMINIYFFKTKSSLLIKNKKTFSFNFLSFKW
uniref:ATP synthase F0 subunit 8 n=1 Tax=Amblyomma parvum TaxID=251391 RepID=UPI002E773E39|nr:ATP synthase F0 subunit 8 [Amblyomma parvum]WQF69059.1 ATP synthase F0 subunit 8 [Amblyomma parvum]